MRPTTAVTVGFIGTAVVQSIPRTFWRCVVALTLLLLGLGILVGLAVEVQLRDQAITPGQMATTAIYSVIAVFICIVSVTKMTDREPFTVFRYGAIIFEARGRRLQKWSILLAVSWPLSLLFTFIPLTIPVSIALVVLATAMIGFGITVGLRPRYYATH